MRARISASHSSWWLRQKPRVAGSRVGGTTVMVVEAEALSVSNTQPVAFWKLSETLSVYDVPPKASKVGRAVKTMVFGPDFADTAPTFHIRVLVPLAFKITVSGTGPAP